MLAASVVVFVYVLGHRSGGGWGGADGGFAVDRFLRLDEDSVQGAGPVVDPDLLKEHSDDYQELEGDALARFCAGLLGGVASIPPAVLEPRSDVAALAVSFRGTPVSNVVLDLQDRRVGVYKLSRDAMLVRDMRLIDAGVTTGLRVERCSDCRGVAVTRGDFVYVLVSRDGADPLAALVRQSF